MGYVSEVIEYSYGEGSRSSFAFFAPLLFWFVFFLNINELNNQDYNDGNLNNYLISNIKRNSHLKSN